MKWQSVLNTAKIGIWHTEMGVYQRNCSKEMWRFNLQKGGFTPLEKVRIQKCHGYRYEIYWNLWGMHNFVHSGLQNLVMNMEIRCWDVPRFFHSPRIWIVWRPGCESFWTLNRSVELLTWFTNFTLHGSWCSIGKNAFHELLSTKTGYVLVGAPTKMWPVGTKPEKN